MAEVTQGCVLNLAIAEAKNGYETYSELLGVGLSNMPDGLGHLLRIMKASGSKNSQIQDGYARGLLDQNRYDDAFAFLTSSYEGEDARSELVDFYLSKGDFDRAIRLAKNAERFRLSLRLKAKVGKALQAVGERAAGEFIYLEEVAEAYQDREKDLPENLCWVAVSSKEIQIEKELELPTPRQAAIYTGVIENTSDREWALRGVIRCMREAGLYRDAAWAASLLDDMEETKTELMHIAYASFKSGDFVGGMRFADTIGKDDSAWRAAYSLMAKHLIVLGRLDQAETMIEVFEGEGVANSSRFLLGAAHLRNNNVSDAKRIVDVAWSDIVKASENKWMMPYFDMREAYLLRPILPKSRVNIVLDKMLASEYAEEQPFQYGLRDLCLLLGQWGRASEALEIIRDYGGEEKKAQYLSMLYKGMVDATASQ